MASFNVDLSVREIFRELSSSEKNDLIDLLENDGYSSYKKEYHKLDNPLNLEFKKNLYKLGQVAYNISKEDEDVLESLFKKYIF